ncbi:hypothetical protein RA307_29225 [Xanthobacteraceae bacterium Astr-EGSB]|uniref:ParE family toxin-like protein n=1 Tax=Astrobacterium formosum TaxID=3069710 RepID=UPI0027B4FD9B|nr:hypothetical protein [Xanthobacteraceae bacterium Astr-EGSB]
MNSRATPDFWACFRELPDHVQARAQSAYALWTANPHHPSLQFKEIPAAGEGVWSVRVGIGWRALGVRRGDEMIWFWIGSHADYDKLIS